MSSLTSLNKLLGINRISYFVHLNAWSPITVIHVVGTLDIQLPKEMSKFKDCVVRKDVTGKADSSYRYIFLFIWKLLILFILCVWGISLGVSGQDQLFWNWSYGQLYLSTWALGRESSARATSVLDHCPAILFTYPVFFNSE